MPLPDDWLRDRGLALTQRLHRQALTDAGTTLRAARSMVESQSARIAQLVPGALAAGIPASEIAARTGLSRQRIYELRASPPIEQSVEQRVLAMLAAEGALALAAISSRLDEPLAEVEARVGDLARAGLVRTAVTRGDASGATTYYGLTPEGEAALEEQFWNGLHGGDEPRFAVYAPLEPAVAAAVGPGAASLFGDDGFAVVSPGTVHRQTRPELAFLVAAATPDEAVARGRERVAELFRLVEAGEQPVIISAIAPAEPVRATLRRG